jgi:hypothetical protein
MIPFRDFSKLQFANDGTRTLFESAIAPEIVYALKDWKEQAKVGVLIGGLALSYWAKPRYTQDADMLFLQPSDVPHSIEKFKAHRKGAFEHKVTQVEIEYAHRDNIPVPQHVIDAVFKTAVDVDGIKVASKSALIALKLHRFWLKDQADIITLAALGGIDLTPFHLEKKFLDMYHDLLDKHRHET